MQGRWTIAVDQHGPGIQFAVGDGWRMVPVVPCDDAAIERFCAAYAGQWWGFHWDELPEASQQAVRHAVKEGFRAAGETP